jgi:hypothetical protein
MTGIDWNTQETDGTENIFSPPHPSHQLSGWNIADLSLCAIKLMRSNARLHALQLSTCIH